MAPDLQLCRDVGLLTTLDARTSRAVRAAFEKRKSGVLVCETEDAKRLVFFESGRLVGARSSLAKERLGAILIREGKVTKQQLTEAVRYLRSGRKMGQSLVELGYLRGGEIESFVRLQIIEIACAMLMASPTRLLFSDQVPVEAITLAPVSTGDVFVEALRRLPDLRRYRETVLLDEYVLRQTDDVLGIMQDMHLPEEEAVLLDLVQGACTVRELLSRSPIEEERTVRLLVAFQYAGIVAVSRQEQSDAPSRPRPTPSGAEDPLEKRLIARFNEIQCQNHWQVLGLSRDATYEQVERAYAKTRAAFASEQFQHLPDAELQEKLAYVQSRVREAYAILCSQTKTQVYDKLVEKEGQYEKGKQEWEAGPKDTPKASAKAERRDPEEAKQLFSQARKAYKARDFWRAIELVRMAIELDDEADAARFHLLGQALAHNPRWRRDAEKNLQIAHRLAPWEPRYLISLGMLYEQEGLTHRAKRVFEQVKAIDPDYADVQVEEPEPRATATELAV